MLSASRNQRLPSSLTAGHSQTGCSVGSRKTLFGPGSFRTTDLALAKVGACDRSHKNRYVHVLGGSHTSPHRWIRWIPWWQDVFSQVPGHAKLVQGVARRCPSL